jgi:tRNA 2-thiouridine synthesizing protein A
MIYLDLSGLNCPLPILKTKKFIATLKPEQTVISITTTDPASFYDFQQFCAKTGHVLLSQSEQNGIITTVIKRRIEILVTDVK